MTTHTRKIIASIAIASASFIGASGIASAQPSDSELVYCPVDRAWSPGLVCNSGPAIIEGEPGWLSPFGDEITEDDPRWDCRTMGNRICGPGLTLIVR